MAKTIGRYEIRDELGRGGMSTVYLAFDSKLHREVALKLMDQLLSTDPAFTARFEREARIIAALEHTAIVSLYDFGEVDGWLYLVMPFMKGGSLKELIAEGPLPPQQATDIVRRIGGALDKAHNKDIIHRDLKPGNILLDEEQEAYLSDFGIVKVAKGDTEYLTQTGQTIGTFAYMSPEQLMGETLDGRSDLYALGIVLYEMLTGKHPYGNESTTDAAMAVAHTQAPIPDVTKENPNLPPAFTGVIHKALAKDAADRYGTGRELFLAMNEALASKPERDTSTANVTESNVTEQTALTREANPPAPSAMPAVDKPATETQVQTPAASSTEERSGSVVDSEADNAGKEASEQPFSAALTTSQKPAPAAVPFPRAIIIVAGLLTIFFGISLLPSGTENPSFPVYIGFGLVGTLAGSGIYILWTGIWIGLYWLLAGLLFAGSLFSKPADWRWKLAVSILAVLAGLVLLVGLRPSFWQTVDTSSSTLITSTFLVAGIMGIIVGLISIVQVFRGAAGWSIVALAAPSIILGILLVILPNRTSYLMASRSLEQANLVNVAGVALIVCGVAAIALDYRERRAAA